MTNMFKRLDYLFKVVEVADKGYFDDGFVIECTDEIRMMITVPEEERETETEEEASK